MAHVFTYGSLMFQEVWNKVITGTYQNKEAILDGYVRKAILNEEYPAIYRASSVNRVKGIVYFDVSDQDIKTLDTFEGEYYSRETEFVVLDETTTIEAEVYVLRHMYHHITLDQEWDSDRFKKYGLTHFLNRYVGFSR